MLPSADLYLIRHAKSSWQNPHLEDWQRPLNSRGQRDCTLLAQRLSQRLHAPLTIVTSPAVRAISTARAIAGQVSGAQLIQAEALYMASPTQIMDCLHRYAESGTSLCLIGHNPGLDVLTCQLDPNCPAHFPTAAVAAFNLEEVLGKRCAACLWWDKPKFHPPYTQRV